MIILIYFTLYYLNYTTIETYFISLISYLLYLAYLHAETTNEISKINKTKLDIEDVEYTIYTHDEKKYKTYGFSYKYANNYVISVSKSLSEDKDLLISIIGHEIGHIKGNHTMIKMIIDIVLVPSLITLTIKEPIIFLVSFSMYYLQSLYINRIMEYLADSYSSKNYGKERFLKLMDYFDRYNKKVFFIKEILSTHPSFRNRRKNIF